MKPESVRTTLSTAVLSWLLAFSTVGCIATAFDFSLAQGLGNLAMVSGLFALAVAFAFRHFPLAAPVTLLLAAQMLSIEDAEIAQKLADMRADMTKKVLQKDAKLQEDLDKILAE